MPITTVKTVKSSQISFGKKNEALFDKRNDIRGAKKSEGKASHSYRRLFKVTGETCATKPGEIVLKDKNSYQEL